MRRKTYLLWIAASVLVALLASSYFMVRHMLVTMNNLAEDGAARCLAMKCDRGVPVPEFNGFGTKCTCKDNEPHPVE